MVEGERADRLPEVLLILKGVHGPRRILSRTPVLFRVFPRWPNTSFSPFRPVSFVLGPTTSFVVLSTVDYSVLEPIIDRLGTVFSGSSAPSRVQRVGRGTSDSTEVYWSVHHVFTDQEGGP